ncbi:hypothetical protein LO80_01005 [Candidatus Francisella endociliophora]|uniref:OTU domain-containing protein n=1 Tax=Candidatus Francisella endociliophora TaxID=653937 RepID=A0A097EM97_9GAMM|nr:hypothetical protein [Francisella sp. FSC1006]AIT08691.1 hypothetical protein LO80_01005 [Francisella sp. FSC1006]
MTHPESRKKTPPPQKQDLPELSRVKQKTHLLEKEKFTINLKTIGEKTPLNRVKQKTPLNRVEQKTPLNRVEQKTPPPQRTYLKLPKLSNTQESTLDYKENARSRTQIRQRNTKKDTQKNSLQRKALFKDKLNTNHYTFNNRDTKENLKISTLSKDLNKIRYKHNTSHPIFNSTISKNNTRKLLFKGKLNNTFDNHNIKKNSKTFISIDRDDRDSQNNISHDILNNPFLIIVNKRLKEYNQKDINHHVTYDRDQDNASPINDTNERETYTLYDWFNRKNVRVLKALRDGNCFFDSVYKSVNIAKNIRKQRYFEKEMIDLEEKTSNFKKDFLYRIITFLENTKNLKEISKREEEVFNIMINSLIQEQYYSDSVVKLDIDEVDIYNYHSFIDEKVKEYYIRFFEYNMYADNGILFLYIYFYEKKIYLFEGIVNDNIDKSQEDNEVIQSEEEKKFTLYNNYYIYNYNHRKFRLSCYDLNFEYKSINSIKELEESLNEENSIYLVKDERHYRPVHITNSILGIITNKNLGILPRFARVNSPNKNINELGNSNNKRDLSAPPITTPRFNSINDEYRIKANKETNETIQELIGISNQIFNYIESKKKGFNSIDVVDDITKTFKSDKYLIILIIELIKFNNSNKNILKMQEYNTKLIIFGLESEFGRYDIKEKGDMTKRLIQGHNILLEESGGDENCWKIETDANQKLELVSPKLYIYLDKEQDKYKICSIICLRFLIYLKQNLHNENLVDIKSFIEKELDISMEYSIKEPYGIEESSMAHYYELDREEPKSLLENNIKDTTELNTKGAHLNLSCSINEISRFFDSSNVEHFILENFFKKINVIEEEFISFLFKKDPDYSDYIMKKHDDEMLEKYNRRKGIAYKPQAESLKKKIMDNMKINPLDKYKKLWGNFKNTFSLMGINVKRDTLYNIIFLKLLEVPILSLQYKYATKFLNNMKTPKPKRLSSIKNSYNYIWIKIGLESLVVTLNEKEIQKIVNFIKENKELLILNNYTSDTSIEEYKLIKEHNQQIIDNLINNLNILKEIKSPRRKISHNNEILNNRIELRNNTKDKISLKSPTNKSSIPIGARHDTYLNSFLRTNDKGESTQYFVLEFRGTMKALKATLNTSIKKGAR